MYGVRCIVSLCTSDRKINDTRDVMTEIEDTSYKSMTIGNAHAIPAPKNKNDFKSDDVRNRVLLRWGTIDDRSIAGAGCTYHRIAPRYQTDNWPAGEKYLYRWHCMNWMDRSAIQPSREGLKVKRTLMTFWRRTWPLELVWIETENIWMPK